MTFTTKTTLLSTICALSLCSPAGVAQVDAQSSGLKTVKPLQTAQLDHGVKAKPAQSSEFYTFTPRAQTKRTRIDYSIWDEALARVVIDLGPSLRKRASKPSAVTGSRRVTGHQTPYRLEGSRFTFEFLTDDYRDGLTAYRKDLEQTGSNLDLTSLSKNEQLAYWYNLHNVAVLEQIALNYPTQRPEQIKVNVDGQRIPFDEAKFITVKGVKMSPKDIRTQIVYPNWSDPDVIYGFYRGDIGSPILPNYAYDSQNVSYTISDNGYEFVNSLRGFHESYGHRNVSAIYDEARPFYFQNWEQDLTAHLLRHAKDGVVDEVRSGKPYRFDRYDNVVADLSGGNSRLTTGMNLQGQTILGADATRMLTETNNKFETLRARGEIGQQPKGWVIIEDLYDEEPVAENAPTISEQEAEEAAE